MSFYLVSQQVQMIINSMKQQLALSLRQSQEFFENQCKICFHAFNDSHHYPMLICQAHHLLCQECFASIKKDRKEIVCPFCKRITKVKYVQRFKYALTANHLYANIKAKYYELLDLYDRSLSIGQERDSAELQRLIGQQRERILPYAEMNSMIASLRSQLSESRQLYKTERSQAEDNKKRVEELTKQLEVYRFKLRIFENKSEMKQQQLQQLEQALRENYEINKGLSEEVQRLNRLSQTQNKFTTHLIKENTALLREYQNMKEQLRKEERRAPKIEFVRSQISQFQGWQSFKQSETTDYYEYIKQNQPYKLNGL